MTEDSVEAGFRFLRAHTTADLRFEEHFRPIKYVIAPSDGRLVAPVMVAMLESFDTVLFVPETIEGAMEVQVTLTEFREQGPDGALADRWRIHHGDPDDVRWAWLSVDAARLDSAVIDGDALMRPNPLAEAEARLCRHVNQTHAAALRPLCRERAGIGVEEPIMVAIDPLGIDVRGRFDIHRVPVDEPMETEAAAEAMIEQMINETMRTPESGA